MVEKSPAAQGAIDLLCKLAKTPRVSRQEQAATDLLAAELAAWGLPVERAGRNLLITLRRGAGPRLMFNSHIDTVAPAQGYKRDPYSAALEDGTLYGLGVNDAGASLVSMCAAALELHKRDDWAGVVQVALVVEEEISGHAGTEALLREVGLPDAAVVGEPTGLDLCVAQKGLVVIDCVNDGVACHVAHAHRLPNRNAVLEAAADVQRIAEISFAGRDPDLGPTTLAVTQISGGVAHNTIPDRCAWVVDGRVNPAQSLDEVVAAVQGVVKARVSARSIRLHAVKTDASAAIVRAAQAARPDAKVMGSDTVSDMVFFRGVPAVKVGPGVTEMSHRPDEHVELRWIREGVRFYRDTALAFFKGSA